MGAEDIIGLVIFCFCALFMSVIGIYQWMDQEPVGFWTWKEAPKKEEITDTKSYNRKHGLMWILYGAGMIIAYLFSLISNNLIISTLILSAAIGGGLLIMIFYHRKLDKIYYIKHDK